MHFNYSYNDPIHEEYFWHAAYKDYPVVGVNWYQANAFCNWKTKKKMSYRKIPEYLFGEGYANEEGKPFGPMFIMSMMTQ